MTPHLEIAGKVSECLNGREELWRNNTQYVATEHFLMLEGFEHQIQGKILSAIQLRTEQQKNVDEITTQLTM